MKDDVGYVSKFLKFQIPERKENVKTISYSQFSQYMTCPKQWELNYVRKMREFTDSIYTVFGTALHETLQTFLTVLYTESSVKAMELELPQMLQTTMFEVYKESVEQNGGVHFSNPTELAEFYGDGVEILNWFLKKRNLYFSKKGVELLGIEMPIYMQASEVNPNVYMNGFVDVVLKDLDLDKIIVYDIKTSTKGWNKYQKSDKIKTSQLVIYKKYLSEQFDWPIDKIEVKYFIVKRKLLDGFMYPQKRVQEFSPPAGKPTINKLVNNIDAFIENCFTESGEYKDNSYLAITGKNKKHCRYCPFNDNDELCPKSERITE